MHPKYILYLLSDGMRARLEIGLSKIFIEIRPINRNHYLIGVSDYQCKVLQKSTAIEVHGSPNKAHRVFIKTYKQVIRDCIN
jgi:hypothetical protein